jgi:hypothetical protein
MLLDGGGGSNSAANMPVEANLRRENYKITTLSGPVK